MIKNRIELIRDAEPKALITWHKPGSSKHFVNLPKHLARLGFRVRVF